MKNNNTIFNQFSEDYDTWYETKMGKFVDEVESEAIFSLLDLPENATILDVGCGTGNFTYKLANMGYNCVGIDIAGNMLKHAKAKQKDKKIKFLEKNAEQTNFEDESFDCIISVTAFEFMPYPDLIYKEMQRLLKPNGSIIIGTIQKGGLWYQLYTSDICKDTAYAKATFLSLEDLKNLDNDQVVDFKECLYLPPTLKEEEYDKQHEEEYKKKEDKGGFVCVKFKKKN